MPTLNRYTLCDGVYLSENEWSELLNESKPWKERIPIGLRFNPTDQALVKIYVDKLFHKHNRLLLFFKDINVYDHEPSKLSGYAHEFGEEKMYFFTHIKKKYSTNSSSTGRTVFSRTAGGGCWKKYGNFPDITIDVEDNSEKLSVRKTRLAFHEREKKSGKEKRTSWHMEEYMLQDEQSYENGENSGGKSDVLALCVIYSHKQRNQNCVSENESCDSNSLYDYPSKRHCKSSVSTFEISYDFSPSVEELLGNCCQSGNEHGSKQQQHPNSHASSGPILQQQIIYSGMGCHSNQQNYPGITPVAAQPPFNHMLLPNMPAAGASDSNRNDRAATATGFEQWPSCFGQNLSHGPQWPQYPFNELGSNQQEQPNSYVPSDPTGLYNSSLPSESAVGSTS